MVPIDLVVFNQKGFFALNHEYPLSLRVLDEVAKNLSLSTVDAAKGYVGFDVSIYFVCDNIGKAALNKKDALVVVLADSVCVVETFKIDLWKLYGRAFPN